MSNHALLFALHLVLYDAKSAFGDFYLLIPSHTALVLRDFFTKNSIHIVPQLPYSPDLASCDFWLFPKLKRLGNRFETIEEIQRESLRALKAIPECDFNSCFEDWKIRWYKCIMSGGDYFEGDEIDLEE